MSKRSLRDYIPFIRYKENNFISKIQEFPWVIDVHLSVEQIRCA